GEQLMGTLEALMMTPTAPSTIQVGSAFYDFIYIPIRTGLILLVASVVFNLRFDAGGSLQATALLIVFIPFVWGLGVASAGGVLLHLVSGSYHGLNDIGALIWELVDGQKTSADLVEAVRQRVDDPPLSLADEVSSFIAALRERELVI